MDRKDAIVTEDDDKKTEESNIKKALAQCRYPEESIDKVKVQKQQPKTMKKNTKMDKAKSKGMVVIPYVEEVKTGVKPHRTLRNMLVHPKDKRDPSQTAEAIYEISCKNCPKSYVGETGRLFRTRRFEHKTETEKLSAEPENYTRSQRKASTSEIFKSRNMLLLVNT